MVEKEEMNYSLILIISGGLFLTISMTYAFTVPIPYLEQEAEDRINNDTSCIWLKAYIEPYENQPLKPIEYKYAIEKWNSPTCEEFR